MIGHHVVSKSPLAIVRSAKLTYIGLRVYSYGPAVTSADDGRIGIGLVFACRNRPTLRSARASPPTTTMTPTPVARAPGAMAKGQRRSSSTPMRIASAYHSGGGNRTPGLSDRAIIADRPIIPAAHLIGKVCEQRAEGSCSF